MNLINFLQLKPSNDTDETIEFEAKFKITLPPIYKCFIQTFVVNRQCIHYPSYFDKDNGSNDNQFTIVNFQKNDELAFSEFYSLMEMIDVKNRIYDEDELELYDTYLPIGGCAFGTTLLLGVTNENKDKIFLEGSFLDEKIILVANDIFDFLKSFTVEINHEYLEIVKINPKHLYLKLGDTIWSVLE